MYVYVYGYRSRSGYRYRQRDREMERWRKREGSRIRETDRPTDRQANRQTATASQRASQPGIAVIHGLTPQQFQREVASAPWSDFSMSTVQLEASGSAFGSCFCWVLGISFGFKISGFMA